MTTTIAAASHTHPLDYDFQVFAERVQARLMTNISAPTARLFETDITGTENLFANYLGAFPEATRQEHNCRACQRFINTFGTLVVLDEQGNATSALWDERDADGDYTPALRIMKAQAERAPITRPFITSQPTWGQPQTGQWFHFYGMLPARALHTRRDLEPHQVAAERREDFGMVMRALADYSKEHVDIAVKLLKTDTLYRAEKVLGVALWFQAMQAALDGVKGSRRDNIVWQAVATAPVGFAHVRSSMIGTLLDDLAAGLPFEDVAAKFKAKMHGLQYQRPQAAPAAGNIAAAEKLIEKLGVAKSLWRRFAALSELQHAWTPRNATTQEVAATGGVFAHLKPKGAPAKPTDVVGPPVTITWEKFARTVLPEAIDIHFHVPHGQEAYRQFVTASHADAPPILQWDRDDARNPVSSFVYNGGASAKHFNLIPSTLTRVAAIVRDPATWHGDMHSNQGNGVTFVLEDCFDTRGAGGTSALFPENLKSELHAVRATIEAYSRSTPMDTKVDGAAAGISLGGPGPWKAVFRVRTAEGQTDYRIDRWD